MNPLVIPAIILAIYVFLAVWYRGDGEDDI
jgi:hypothetical protein